MTKNKKRGSLKKSFIAMTVLPVIALVIVILAFSYSRVKRTIINDAKNELENTAFMVRDMLDEMYPGDYSTITTETQTMKIATLTKGGEFLVERAGSFIEKIKADTGSDITLFYGNKRFITTLKYKNGDSLQNTVASEKIYSDVVENNQKCSYNKIKVIDENCVAYYIPLHNADEKICVGMIGVTKSTSEVSKDVWRAVGPTIAIAAVVMLIAVFFTVRYSESIIGTFEKINKFLGTVESGSLDASLSTNIIARDDELGQMARAAVSMQNSIKQLVERDALTLLYNRRYANTRIAKSIKKANDSGTKLAISIGDIDYFKKFNDTYGHDAGDEVLIGVARVMSEFMIGKGFVARWGGEEFLLLFENMDSYMAEEQLNAMLDKIHEMTVEYNDLQLKVNMSFGVSDVNTDEVNIENSLKNSDNLLYTAKENGRNQVVRG